MPTYVYKFIETGETIEVQQAFTDSALTEAVHPGTGRSMAVKKVFTPVGVTFKGGGFYKTDSRGSSSSSSSTSTAGAGSATTAAPTSTSSASGESGAAATSSAPAASGTSTGAA